mgnify:CR=1 FL=1
MQRRMLRRASLERPRTLLLHLIQPFEVNRCKHEARRWDAPESSLTFPRSWTWSSSPMTAVQPGHRSTPLPFCAAVSGGAGAELGEAESRCSWRARTRDWGGRRGEQVQASVRSRGPE